MFTPCRFILLLICLFLCTECATPKKKIQSKAPQKPEFFVSEFGYFHDSQNRLISIPDGGEIVICPGTQTQVLDKLKSAISTWGAVISRSYIFKESCVNPHISLYGRKDERTQVYLKNYPEFKKRCYQPDLAFVSGIYPQTGMELVTCWEPSQKTPMSVILHETGHLFGLCDQYKEGITQCARTQYPVKKSLMNDQYANTTLQEDDKEGLRNLLYDYLVIPIAEKSSWLKEDEILEYSKKGSLGGGFFAQCQDMTSQRYCVFHNCIWESETNLCLSSWFSACSSAKSDNTCRQILSCSWKDKSCSFSLFDI